MDFVDYIELRRRAEKRLANFSIWPLLLFQCFAYGLVIIGGASSLVFPLLATLASFGLAGVSLFVYWRQTAANRAVRRRAIDETLEEAVDAGWPLENPSLRDLRLLATLLDDDLDTRSGQARAAVWSSLLAASLWPVTYLTAAYNQYAFSASFRFYGLLFFGVWLVACGGLWWSHRRTRHASTERTRSALVRASLWGVEKAKIAAEAPWWSEDDGEPALVKRKRTVLGEEISPLLDDDGEIADDFDALRHGQRSS
jgi:hypothetical protein